MKYLKDHTYNVIYLDDKGEEKEVYFTPTKDTSRVGVIEGVRGENQDFFKLINITEGKEIVKESEDLTSTKQNIEQAVETDKENLFDIDVIKENIDVLITDEEAAIKGYEEFVNQAKETISPELVKALETEIEEIINDEKEHIEKLNMIKESLVK